MDDHEAHERSIEILETIETDDYRKLIVSLAKVQPDLFCRLYEDIGEPDKQTSLHERCAVLIADDKVVTAIKLMRSETGFGLHVSKVAIDKLRLNMPKGMTFSEEVAAQLVDNNCC